MLRDLPWWARFAIVIVVTLAGLAALLFACWMWALSNMRLG